MSCSAAADASSLSNAIAVHPVNGYFTGCSATGGGGRCTSRCRALGPPEERLAEYRTLPDAFDRENSNPRPCAAPGRRPPPGLHDARRCDRRAHRGTYLSRHHGAQTCRGLIAANPLLEMIAKGEPRLEPRGALPPGKQSASVPPSYLFVRGRQRLRHGVAPGLRRPTNRSTAGDGPGSAPAPRRVPPWS